MQINAGQRRYFRCVLVGNMAHQLYNFLSSQCLPHYQFTSCCMRSKYSGMMRWIQTVNLRWGENVPQLWLSEFILSFKPIVAPKIGTFHNTVSLIPRSQVTGGTHCWPKYYCHHASCENKHATNGNANSHVQYFINSVHVHSTSSLIVNVFTLHVSWVRDAHNR